MADVAVRFLHMLVWVAVGLVVLGLLVRLFEGSFVYFPHRYPLGVWDPARLGLEAEDVTFTAADGTRLHGWWIPASFSGVRPDDRGVGAGEGRPPAEAAPVLLWCHGNAGNLTYRAHHARRLAEAGLAVFLFDYRGYGRSEGSPSEEGIYLDAEAAYRQLVEGQGIPPGRVVLYGRSLGSAPAARLATRVEHAGLVLVSPFPSARAMARRLFLGLPLHWFARSRFPVAEWAAQRSGPLLVIHGEADTVVPYDLGRRVFELAAEPKQFLGLPGAGHNDILEAGGERYLETLAAFCRRVVEAP